MNIELSIIIPVYNSGNFLHECLDSVKKQTFSDFEVWLIDDGSTDYSGNICDEYVRDDLRFHVIHQKNGGVSHARNVGITHARGKKLAFVDSDDTLLSTCFQRLMEKNVNDVGIVIAGYGGERSVNVVKENVFLEGETMKRYFIENEIFSQSGPCQKIFLTNVIKSNNILFPVDVHMGEDMIFFVKYMNCVNSAVLVASNEYHVRSHDGSLSTKYYSYESERKCFELWKDEISKFVESISLSKEDKEKKMWETRSLETYLRTLECLYKSNHDLDFKQKLNILNMMDKKELVHFLCYYTPIKVSSKVMTFLIKNRFFVLFLILGYFHNFLKNKLR